MIRTLPDIRTALKNRTLTVKSLILDTLDVIQKTEPLFNCTLHTMAETALQQAETIDQEFDKGNPLPALAGIPIAIKDNMCLINTPTTCASKILQNFKAPYTATAVQKLLDHHMIPIIKTNLDEFAMGSSTENSAFGPTKNPWNTDCVPGGSSGGSAASVAAQQISLSLGSDTGGSIRQPAAFCGIVGVKPTYGRVSRYGLVAFASSLDQIGPFAHTVEDAAHLLNVISGHDPLDSTSSKNLCPDFTATLNRPISGLKIGVPKELLGPSIDPEIKAAVLTALDLLKTQGAKWEETSLSSFETAVATYYILAPAEASSNLARFDGVRYGFRSEKSDSLSTLYTRSRGEGFGPEVKRRIILGTYVLSSGYYDAYYVKAQKVRQLITQDFAKAFQKYDLIITPTTPTPAFKFGEHTQDPLSMYLADIATIPVNLAGLPAMSIPCGFSQTGLPLGLQLITKAFDEATLLQVGHAYQQLTAFHLERPPSLKGQP